MTDSTPDMGGFFRKLRQLIDEAEASETQKRSAVGKAAQTLSAADLTELVAAARTIRLRHFDNKLFGEPAWDILLGLHQAYHRGQAISVSAAVTFGNTPTTTGLRWLTDLAKAGLVERRSDADDLRRTFVALTPDAVERMDTFAAAFAEWVEARASIRKH